MATKGFSPRGFRDTLSFIQLKRTVQNMRCVRGATVTALFLATSLHVHIDLATLQSVCQLP
jgi:hypothetical protein